MLYDRCPSRKHSGSETLRNASWNSFGGHSTVGEDHGSATAHRYDVQVALLEPFPDALVVIRHPREQLNGMVSPLCCENNRPYPAGSYPYRGGNHLARWCWRMCRKYGWGVISGCGASWIKTVCQTPGSRRCTRRGSQMPCPLACSYTRQTCINAVRDLCSYPQDVLPRERE